MAAPVPLPLQNNQTKLSQLWDIKHNIFSQKEKVGNWRQKLSFDTKTKVFTIDNYSLRKENLGAQQIEEFLTAKSNIRLEPVSYYYVFKKNREILKTIKARFYKKWQTKVLLSKSKAFIKKRKVGRFKNTNQLWVSAQITQYKGGKIYKQVFNKALPAPVFLSAFLSLVLSQKIANNQPTHPLTNKHLTTKHLTTKIGLQKALAFTSFSEENLQIEKGTATLTQTQDNAFTWKSQYKDYSFNTTMDRKGKLIKTNMPLRQLHSQIISL